QYVFHVGDKGRAGVRWNHPLLLEVRFENVFFSVRPIVLSLARSTMCSSTTFSSSRRRLQRAKPSGAGERVSAINFASATPSKIRGRAELGLYLRLNTASNPSSTSWRLVRSIVAMLVSSAAAIRLSLQPSPSSDTSAFSRMRAFVSSWAERLPLRINSSSWACSCRLLSTSAKPEEAWAGPAGAGHGKGDLRQAAIGGAVPGKALVQDHDALGF